MRVVLHTAFVLQKNTGITRYILGLLDALAAADTDTEFVLLWPPSEPWPERFPPNFTREPLTIGTGGGAGHPLARIVRESGFLKRLHRRRPFDLLHSLFGYLPLATPTPAVVTLPDLRVLRHPETFSPLRRAFLKGAIPRSLRRAALTLPMSAATKQEALRLVPGLEPERLIVCHPGVDPFWFAPPEPDAVDAWRSQLGRFALAVGTAEPHKNLPRLIEAFTALRPRTPELRLALVGETFASGRRDRLALPDGVVPLGRVDDAALRALYAACAAYCFPSLYEGFGYPPLEALAAGAPVVAAAIPPLAEVLGEAARFADPYDPQAIGDALAVALRDDDPGRAERGRAWARRYDWATHAAAVLAAYRRA